LPNDASIPGSAPQGTPISVNFETKDISLFPVRAGLNLEVSQVPYEWHHC
jgi:hypothetical protein